MPKHRSRLDSFFGRKRPVGLPLVSGQASDHGNLRKRYFASPLIDDMIKSSHAGGRASRGQYFRGSAKRGSQKKKAADPRASARAWDTCPLQLRQPGSFPELRRQRVYLRKFPRSLRSELGLNHVGIYDKRAVELASTDMAVLLPGCIGVRPQSGRAALCQCLAACRKCSAAVSASGGRDRLYVAQCRGGRAIRNSSPQCGVGSLDRRTQECIEHAFLSARACRLRQIRQEAEYLALLLGRTLFCSWSDG